MNSEEIRLANRKTGPVSYRVYDDDLVKKLKKIVLNHWKTSNEKDFFPAPQPISLERRDLSKLVDYEYFVCAKSDGMRFLLMCYGGSCYMVDRAFKFYEVTLKFKNKDLYESEEPYEDKLGGIFDGELVLNNDKEWQYVIHDCVNINGNIVSHLFLNKRLEAIKKLTSDYFIQENSEFNIKTKQFFTFKNLYLLEKFISRNQIDHKTDGIIFTPKNKKVGSQTQYDLFKWKPRQLQTFDFKIVKNSEGITAYVNKDEEHIPYATAVTGSPEEKLFLEGLEKNCEGFTNNSIVECDYDNINDSFIPVKIRMDKTHPNSLYTVKKTFSNIKEDITMRELLQLAQV